MTHSAMRAWRLRTFVLAVCVGGAAACGGGAGSDAGAASTDTDGDGLTDAVEATWGTNPAVADTDGDGWTDYDEVVNMAFDPDLVTGNPYSFNPLIADVPKIAIRIAGLPDVNIHYVTSAGATTTIGTETTRSTESASTVTTSETGTSTSAVETVYADKIIDTLVSGTTTTSGCTTVAAGADASVDLGFWALGSDTSASSQTCFEAEINSSLATSVEERNFSESTTSASSLSWSSAQARENREAYALAQSYQSENTINTSLTSGEIVVSVNLQNVGQMTFVPSNVYLSAVLYDPLSPTRFAPLGNLSFDGGAFPPNALAPGETSSGLTFANRALPVATVQKILANPLGLVVAVSTYDVLDADGRSFRFEQTTIDNRTATVVIDFGGAGGRRPERYMVATDTTPGAPGVTLGEIMTNVLRIPYSAGTQTAAWNGHDLTGLRTLRGVTSDPVVRGYWLVLREHFDAGLMQQVVETYNPLVREYDFDAIDVYAGQTVYVLFVRDQDRDGLNSREEALNGSSDTSTDTDGDGIGDYDEVETGWTDAFTGAPVFPSPAAADIDGDGWTDVAERTNGTNPWNPDTDGDRMTDAQDPAPVTADLTGPGTPGAFSVVAATGVARIDLSWTAPSDAGGWVTGYQVFRGGTALASATGTSWSDGGVAEATQYCYQVRAIDYSGNASSPTSELCATTADLTRPNPPTSVSATPNVYAMAVAWSGASDNVGVAKYQVYRGTSYLGETASASWSEPNLTAETSYCYTVRAVDAAGNLSVDSGAACATTGPRPPSNPAWTSNADGTATITWVDNSNIETGYSIGRCSYRLKLDPVCTTFTTAFGTTATNTTSFTFTPSSSLIYGYNYAVWAAGPNGGSTKVRVF